MAPIEELQQRWKTLYGETLPQLAVTHDEVQPHWPVHVDHCFGRIILDNAVGVTKPWMAVLKSPAWKNMTASQLEDVIELGESIATGQVNLDDLNRRSLELREKNGPPAAKSKATKRKAEADSKEPAKEAPRPKSGSAGIGDGGKTAAPAKKRKTDTISSYFLPSPDSKAGTKQLTESAVDPIPDPKPSEANEQPPKIEQSPPLSSPPTSSSSSPPPPTKQEDDPFEADTEQDTKRTDDLTPTTYDPSIDPLILITSSNLTPFRKQILSLLVQVPRGRYTTYAALSSHVSGTTHKTCARAVGNAMRNNPFAPVVPCHRVLAHDGRIGGFGGYWGEEGKWAGKKREMLRQEGVRFDGKGRVVGSPFQGFTWVS